MAPHGSSTRLLRPRRTGALRYVVAVALALAAMGPTMLLMPIVGAETVVWFLAAVAVSAFYGGLGPGLATMITSTILYNYYLVPPAGFSLPTEAEFVRTLGFTVVAILMTMLSDRLIRTSDMAQGVSAAKSRLLSIIGHELRTPLGAIGGYLDLLELELHGPLTTEQREDLSRIRRNQQYLLSVVRDALQLERVETGRVTYASGNIALEPLLAGIEPIVAPQLHGKGLTFMAEHCDGALYAYADPEKVEQILVNLVTNAIKYTDQGGSVRLRCAADAREVRVMVMDTGVGIAPEKLESVFEPFVQASQTVAGRRQGVGLGLAISRDLARGMGGELTVESTPGEGSTFTLTLPRGTAPPASRATPARGTGAARA